MAKLARFVVGPVLRVVDGVSRPDPDVTICQYSMLDIMVEYRGARANKRIPPPAVASLEPSGETWQL